MDARVKDVVSSLATESEDVRMIGIKGIGGGGKTTLARVVFDHISNGFEGSSFVENVREVSKHSLSGLKKLQNQVLKDVLNDQSIVVKDVYDGKNKMIKMLGSSKVLVVLDDVDYIGQLEALAGNPNWFKPGSRIIITTRDEQLLIAHRVHFILDVNLLSNEEALCLFSRHAFGRELPIHGYQELSKKVVQYGAGLPLTLKVLGSHLCGRSEPEWVDAIERLKTIPLKETLEKLELSYNGLEDDEKEIFLDVVCILKGETKIRAIRVLQCRGFNAQIGLRVLEQKSLITVSASKYEGLGFHDHIEEMGWNIVRRLHPNKPSRHSRLRIQEEIEELLVNEMGTKETKCIKLDYTGLDAPIILKGLQKMKGLRFFYVNSRFCYWNVNDVSQYLPDSLQVLSWHEHPFQFLHETFQAENLVNHEMHRSKISELWDKGEGKVLNKLKILDLKMSNFRTFDLRLTPHLEVFDFKGCDNFEELHMLVECPNLKVLKLNGCKVSKLNLGLTPCLEKLNLDGCEDFLELQLPVQCRNLKVLKLGGSKVSNLNLGMTPHLELLNLEGCEDFVQLQLPTDCPNLKVLKLVGSKVRSLNLEMTPHLEYFSFGPYVYENPEYILETICGLQHLRELTLEGSIPQDVWRLQSLEKLSLREQQFRHLPESICMLKHLTSLELDSCLALEHLPENIYDLGRLEDLIIWNCVSLRDIPNNICKMKCLKWLELNSCDNIKKLPEDLGSLECLQQLWIKDTGISRLPWSIYKLKRLRIYGSMEQLVSFGFTSVKNS